MSAGLALNTAVRMDRLLSGDVPSAAGAMPERPEGPVVWCHAPDTGAAQALEALAPRLAGLRSGLTVAVSGTAVPGTLPLPLPPDRRALMKVLELWKPQAALLFGSVYRPSMVAAAAGLGVPVLGLALRSPTGSWMEQRIWRGLARRLLAVPQRLLAEDRLAEESLRRQGAPEDRVEVAGLMAPQLPILPSNEAERESVAELISSRPVWCAAALPFAELSTVIEAHRIALQRSHRLLLVIVPADIAEAQAMQLAMVADGWNVGLRSNGDEPTDDINVYIADYDGELGLWLRLAAIAFLGGTLSWEKLGRSPMEAAALGSAVLHGPETGAWATDYRRLAAAGAAIMAAKPVDIAAAVETLIAPDKAAAMAHAAWEVSSAGEDAISRTLAAIEAVLPGESA